MRRSLLHSLLVSCLWLADGAAALAEEGAACRGIDEGDLAPALRSAADASRVSWRSPRWRRGHDRRVQILSINDFHGRLSTGLTVAGRPVGGAAVLASYLRAEEAAFLGDSFVVHAGDHVGASPPDSALLQDEPAIDVINLLACRGCRAPRAYQPFCNVIGTLGNHEFDEGVGEPKRLLHGGNHPRGPFLESPWQGARYDTISANVVDEATGEPLLAPTSCAPSAASAWPSSARC